RVAAQPRVFCEAFEVTPGGRHSGASATRTTVRNCAPENLEIPRGAIAPLRSGPSDHPGMTELCISNRQHVIVDLGDGVDAAQAHRGGEFLGEACDRLG